MFRSEYEDNIRGHGSHTLEIIKCCFPQGMEMLHAMSCQIILNMTEHIIYNAERIVLV